MFKDPYAECKFDEDGNMKKIGSVTDQSYLDCSLRADRLALYKSPNRFNDDVDMMLICRAASKRRIYSDEIPMAKSEDLDRSWNRRASFLVGLLNECSLREKRV